MHVLQINKLVLSNLNIDRIGKPIIRKNLSVSMTEPSSIGSERVYVQEEVK